MNDRGQNQSHQRKYEGMYTNPNQFPQAVQVQNPGYIISGPRNPRHYVNPSTHNVSEIKNNHLDNMAHSQIQMVPAHISQRQQAVYLPTNVAYQRTSNHPTYYPFSPPQASQTALPIYLNYPSNQQGMFYSQPTRPIQMTNLPQGPQNPPVSNMSSAQNSHGQSLIVQSQPMDMAPNTQPLQQVSQQPSTTPMQITEASSRPVRKKVLIKIIDPNTGGEFDLNKPLRGPPSADELEKTKVQSQVQTAVKKDDTKLSDNIPDILRQQENKENENTNHNSKNEEEESIIPKPEELLQQPEETQNDGIQHKPIVADAAPKLPSYLDKLPYAEGQWSVTNPTGKKVYSKLFLIQLGSEAVCQKKPDVLRNWSNLTKLSSAPQFNSLGGMVPNLPRSQSASATGYFMPSYFKAGNSQRGGSGMPIMQPGAKRNSSQGKTAKPNTIHMSLSLREEVKLNQTENAWVPTAAKKATKSEVVKTKNEEESKNDEINKSVRSILNEISPDNMSSLKLRLKALPITSIECLEITINLVFEKAIEKQRFSPLCASLCSAMQTVQVISNNDKEATFKKMIISKCQSQFEILWTHEIDSVKKLTEIILCKDPEMKKGLQLEFEKNERILHRRSIRNCRFMGELFKNKIISPNIMMYCIGNLMTKHAEKPLECLCILLKTIGEELEQSYNLNDTFDQLKALTSKEIKYKIPSRIIFMIQDVIDVRKDKWIPGLVDCNPKSSNKIEDDEIEQQSISLANNIYEKLSEYKNCRVNDNVCNDYLSLNQTKYKQQNNIIGQSILQDFKPKVTIEQPVLVLNSAVPYKMKMKCKNILLEYERLQNLEDIIYSLSEDKSSVIRTRHEDFVQSMSLITLDSNPISQTTVTGKIFAELLSKKILSMEAITQGIDAVLKDWNDYLIDYPHFFSYIASIIAQLFLSQNASFDFNNLKDSCTSIRPENSSKFFTEVLNKILSSKETQNIKEHDGILWIYNKWNTSEYVTLDIFIPNNQINKYLKKEQIGVFLLSIAIYDKMMLTNNKLLYNILQSWICTNISEEIIKSPLFARALTIAIVIVCLKLNHSYEDFFDHIQVKLLSHYIEFEPLPEHEIQARKVQCMYGIQLMSAMLEHPGGMVLKLFNKLYQYRVISKESFELFIQKYEEITEK